MSVVWIAKDRASGLNHVVATTLKPSTAQTACGVSLNVKWRTIVEMPPCATITCLLCISEGFRARSAR